MLIWIWSWNWLLRVISNLILGIRRWWRFGNMWITMLLITKINGITIFVTINVEYGMVLSITSIIEPFSLTITFLSIIGISENGGVINNKLWSIIAFSYASKGYTLLIEGRESINNTWVLTIIFFSFKPVKNWITWSSRI